MLANIALVLEITRTSIYLSCFYNMSSNSMALNHVIATDNELPEICPVGRMILII